MTTRTVAALLCLGTSACDPPAPPDVPSAPQGELCATPLLEQLAAEQASPELDQALAQHAPTVEERAYAAAFLALAAELEATSEPPEMLFDHDLEQAMEASARAFPAFFAPCGAGGAAALSLAGDDLFTCAGDCTPPPGLFRSARDVLMDEARRLVKRHLGLEKYGAALTAVRAVLLAIQLAAVKAICVAVAGGKIDCNLHLKEAVVELARENRPDVDRVLATAGQGALTAAALASGPAAVVLSITAGLLKAFRLARAVRKDLKGAREYVHSCNYYQDRFCGLAPDGQWLCRESGRTQPVSSVCNGASECADGRDEDPTGCAMYCGEGTKFLCTERDPPSCVPLAAACDDAPQCANGEDESPRGCLFRSSHDSTFQVHDLVVRVEGNAEGVTRNVVANPRPLFENSYRPGTRVELTAQAFFDTVFVGWSGDCTGTDPICIVEMDGPKAVVARFIDEAAPAATIDSATCTCRPPNILGRSECDFVIAGTMSGPPGSVMYATIRDSTDSPLWGSSSSTCSGWTLTSGNCARRTGDPVSGTWEYRVNTIVGPGYVTTPFLVRVWSSGSGESSVVSASNTVSGC